MNILKVSTQTLTLLLCAWMLVAAPVQAQETTPAPEEVAALLERLTTAYGDALLDPSAESWAALLAHPDYADGEIVYLEIAALNAEERSGERVDAYLAALTAAVADAGGELILAYDILSAGTGDLYELEGDTYVGGAAHALRLPSRAALVEVLLDPAVVAAHAERRSVLAQLQIMLGVDRLPAVIANLPKDVDAATIPTPYVDGKSPDDLLDELLSIYPDGGADPNRAQLEAILNWSGYADVPLYYLNLYDWGSYGEDGAAAHDRYNSQAQDEVMAHGVRVYARVDIEQNLVGPYGWDRLVLPRWPSFEVFTNLRLVPSYYEAQLSRVESADLYGNYITTAREYPMQQ